MSGRYQLFRVAAEQKVEREELSERSERPTFLCGEADDSSLRIAAKPDLPKYDELEI